MGNGLKNTVVLLGSVSPEEMVLTESFFSEEHYRILHFENAGKFRNVWPTGLPSAFISWIPCSPEGLLGQFAHLPVGTGERIPFFQQMSVEKCEWIRQFPIAGFFSVPIQYPALHTFLRVIQRNALFLERLDILKTERDDAHAEMDQLVAVGTMLSSEHDLKKLLEAILTNCRKAVCADAGSIYIRERTLPGGPLTDSLIFTVAQNDSVDTGRSVEYRLPVNTESIAGYVAFSGRALRIDDAACIPEDAPYTTSKTFQRYFDYRIISMLTVPLINLRHEVVGVLQLMNRKKDLSSVLRQPEDFDAFVQPFSMHDERFVLSVAQLAAVSVERAQLHENITALFEGFLKASITSVDERDRVTSGHSRRVMRYAMAFVDAAQHHPEHPFHVLCSPPERRRQFQFAALLHDIGKIGVPEFVLTKEQRLPRDELLQLMANFDYIGFSYQVKPETVEWESREAIEEDRAFLLRINGSGYITPGDREQLAALGRRKFLDFRGDRIPLLSAYALEALSVPRGNLTAAERELVNSHAYSTHRILSMIPWTESLIDVPLIAAQHHERIDGSGYPQGITGDRLSLESRILAVIDVYEALVAQDRPYKPKMPVDKAIDILESEADARHLDREVVRFFLENRIHLLYCQDEGSAQ